MTPVRNDDGFSIALVDSRSLAERWRSATSERAPIVLTLKDALAVIDALRLDGENLFEAFNRLAVACAYSESGKSEKAAGKLLGITPRAMNHYLSRYGLRPVDRLAAGTPAHPVPTNEEADHPPPDASASQQTCNTQRP